MKKYKLTEDMAQYRKYWMTKILAGPAQGDGKEMWEPRMTLAKLVKRPKNSTCYIIGTLL